MGGGVMMHQRSKGVQSHSECEKCGLADLPTNPAGSCFGGTLPSTLQPKKDHRSVRPCFLIGFVLACGTALLAQPPERSLGAAAGRGAARASSFTAALAWFTSGNLPAAETALFKDNLQRPGTIRHDVECATRLTHVALVLRERLDYRTANVVSTRALAYLAEAKSARFTNATPQGRAEVNETIGFIYERLLADPVAAKAAFGQAQRELPSSKAAQAGLDRIKETEDKLARLPGGRG